MISENNVHQSFQRILSFYIHFHVQYPVFSAEQAVNDVHVDRN